MKMSHTGKGDAFRWRERRYHVHRKEIHAPVHPGELLMEDFLRPMGITQYRLAEPIGIAQRRIGEIVAGKRTITADTALRLVRFFGTDAQSWIILETHYDLELAQEKLSDRTMKEVQPLGVVAQGLAW